MGIGFKRGRGDALIVLKRAIARSNVLLCLDKIMLVKITVGGSNE
jgi:hypothetical protein